MPPKPEHWTASNPEEHLGLEYAEGHPLPATGVEFRQRERVAGVPADLRGKFLYVDRPRLAIWTGTASYRLAGGLVRIRVPEGGVLRLQPAAAGTRMSHDVFIDFPNSRWGALVQWVFLRLLNGRAAVYRHTMREPEFFKLQVEARAIAQADLAGPVSADRHAALR